MITVFLFFFVSGLSLLDSVPSSASEAKRQFSPKRERGEPTIAKHDVRRIGSSVSSSLSISSTVLVHMYTVQNVNP